MPFLFQGWSFGRLITTVYVSKRKKKVKGAEEKKDWLQQQEFSHSSSSTSLSSHCSPTSSQLHRDEAEGGTEPLAAAPLPPNSVDLHLHHLPAMLPRQLDLGARGGYLRLRGGAGQESEGPLCAGMSRGTLPGAECHQDTGDVAAPGSGHPG